MSEYQYYEFQAIDRPLDKRAMTALRAITSRAEITPTSLINEYHWGDFKGDPLKLMEQYFDAFLYFANWGTHRLMLRLPRQAFDLAEAEPYCVPHILDAKATREHVILDFHSEEEEPEWEEEPGWLASLIPLRAELLSGDLRCLYLAWLRGVQTGEVDEESTEPPVPPGLGKCSASLNRFADFMRLDLELLEVAAAGSATKGSEGPSEEELAAWVVAIPEEEKAGLLVRVIQGEGNRLGLELLKCFRDEQARRAVRSSRSPPAARRTAASLLEARDRLTEERRRRAEEKAARERERRAREQAAARARYLDDLAQREEKAWQEVEAAIQTRQPREYDRAVQLLRDLRDLGEHRGTTEEVAARIQHVRERHSGKPSLMARLDKARL